jgi:transposase
MTKPAESEKKDRTSQGASRVLNVSDLADEDKLASHFGLVPRVANSNETVHHGGICRLAKLCPHRALNLNLGVDSS